MQFSKINKHFYPDQEAIDQAFIYLSGEINQENISPVLQQILAYNIDDIDPKDPDEDDDFKPDVINLLICSPGGDVPSAISLISIIEASEIPIRTIALGECGSAALMILMAGHQRVITPYASILSHQFSSESGGNYSSIKATMKEFDNYHEKIVKYYMEKTGLERIVVESVLLKDVDTWLLPAEAVNYKIADLVCDLK